MKPTEELHAEARAYDRTLKEDAELFGVMVKTPAWKRYLALVESVAQEPHSVLVRPLENLFEATKAEYAKGTLNGLTLATSLPHITMKQAQELRPAGDNDEE